MEFTLKLVFTGLIAFVPMKDGAVNYDHSSIRSDQVVVLLVDARDPDPEEDYDGKPFEAHRALLRFTKGSHKNGREAELDCVNPSDPASRCQVELEEENLDLHYDAPPGVQLVLITGTRIDSLPCCTNPTDVVCRSETRPYRLCWGEAPWAAEQMADFNWLISFREVLPKATILNECLTGLADCPAVVRLVVNRGILSSLELQGEPGVPITTPAENFLRSERVLFAQKPIGSGWYPRAVARRMVLSIPGVEDSVKIGSDIASDLEIGPPADCADPCEVEVELMNSPEHEIADDPYDPTYSRRHFELLWSFLQTPPTDRPAPYRAGTGGPHVDLLCPQVQP